MKFKDIVDLSSLEYAKLEIICPIIVSAEFLRRARKKFLKATDRTVRATIIASQLGLAGGLPPPSPKNFFASGPGISSELRPEQINQQTEEEKTTAEIARIFELRDLTAVERKISPSYFAWLTSTSRYLSLSVEQAMGLFRMAFEKRQPQCLAFRISGEEQNKKISVLMKDFGVLEWNGELSAASFVELTPYQGSWFMSSVGELPRDTLENVQRNSTDLRPCPPRAPESQEQRLFSDISVFGVIAGLGKRGEVVISDLKGEKIREINLPPVSSLEFGRVQLSPDGTNLAVFRRFRVGQQDGRDIFLINNMTGETLSILPDVARARDFYGLDFFWFPDGKRVAAEIYLGMSKDIAIIDAKSGEVLASIPTITWGQFSPDGEWYAALVRDRLEVININGPKVGIENIGGVFSWSRDNRLLALYECTRWRRPPGFAPMCEVGNLAVYDLANQRIGRLNIPALVRAIPIFSYDGSKILFEGTAGLSVFDRSTRRTIRLQLPSDIAVDRFTWFSGFHRSGDVLLYSPTREASIVWINPENGQVRAYQTIETERGETASIREVTQDSIIYEVFRAGGDRRDLYMAPITKNNTPIRGKKIAGSLIISSQGGSEVLGWLKEGDIFTSGKKTFIFQDGKRHLVENEEAVDYFQGNRSALAEGLAPFIPEGEKISFRPGDVIGHKDSGVWYLRNGKRYKVQNWDWFRNNQRFNTGGNPEFRRGEWTVPRWLIERIPEGEVPQPAPGETGIKDWDGTMKEFQPFGGRMIIFMGGYNGNTQSQQEAFKKIKEKLMERGWRENQFLEATYNIDIDAQRRLVLPKAYLAKDTKVYPPQSVSKLRLQLQRYEETFPLTSFIIVGHSLGGFKGFEAALAHPDAVQAVITLDSPLKGVDRAFLVELPELLDQAVEMVGDEVMKYMNALGDDSARRQEQEAKAWQLYTRKVRVFTFSNDDDWFVRNGVAVLENSASEFEGQPVRLIWQLGHLSPHGIGDLASGHKQILQEESFLEELARILPAS